MAYHIFINTRAVFFRVFQHVRSWAHKTHVACEYIKELRKFIKAGLTKKSANSCNTYISFTCLELITVSVYLHTPEFVTTKRFILFSRSFLNKENRTT